jgi:hypothetical protein
MNSNISFFKWIWFDPTIVSKSITLGICVIYALDNYVGNMSSSITLQILACHTFTVILRDKVQLSHASGAIQ